MQGNVALTSEKLGHQASDPLTVFKGHSLHNFILSVLVLTEE